MDSDNLAQLRIIKQWYRAKLGIKMSIASFVRLASSEFVERTLKEIETAKQGRLHAKLRPQGQNPDPNKK